MLDVTKNYEFGKYEHTVIERKSRGVYKPHPAFYEPEKFSVGMVQKDNLEKYFLLFLERLYSEFTPEEKRKINLANFIDKNKDSSEKKIDFLVKCGDFHFIEFRYNVLDPQSTAYILTASRSSLSMFKTLLETAPCVSLSIYQNRYVFDRQKNMYLPDDTPMNYSRRQMQDINHTREREGFPLVKAKLY